MLAIKITIISLFISYCILFADNSRYRGKSWEEWQECSFNEKERQKLDKDSYYKNLYHYVIEEILSSCDDAFSVNEKERDPRGCGFIDAGYSSNDEFRSTSIAGKVYKYEGTHIYTDDNGIKSTTKTITCKNHKENKNFKEEIITIHDKKSKLLFSKHYKWDNKMLVQTIDDGVVRNITKGKTYCDIIITEPSGDTTFLKLDPSRISGSIKNDGIFRVFLHGDNIFGGEYDRVRNEGKAYSPYDAIIYQLHSLCKEHYKLESYNLSQQDELDSYVESEEDNFLFYISQYKYYAIIAICIALACVMIIRKRLGVGK